MKKIALRLLILGMTFLSVFYAAPAQAQATRTWVSGVGDDANPCSRTAPCKTFAGAISKTATAGEINCLDPGGFGGVTITKSITIDCHEVFGSVLVAGTNGITISASGGIVILRNLNIDGAGSGLKGISISAASTVYLEDMSIRGFTQQGIADTRTGGGTKLFIKNSVIRNNSGAGIAAAAGGTTGVVVDRVHSNGNGFGIAAGAGNNVAINHSVFSGNSSAGVETDPGGQVHIENSIITHNSTGIQPGGPVEFANSNISFNSLGISGATTSYGNNRISGNSTAGTLPTVVSSQ